MYSETPFHLCVRSQMIKWIKYLVLKLKYSRKTYHLSVSYIDFVFTLCNVQEKEFKLVCFVCMYMAAKMEEKDEKIPYIEVILN